MKVLSLFGAAMLVGAIAAKDVCRALVLSSGGSNGAWEAGVIHGLINNGNPSDFEWDVISGVSFGAMNTVALAGYPLG